MNLEERIGIYYTSLTKSEKNVYQAVLANPKGIINKSIQEAAKTYNVSSASIQRFVKKVGYRGYTEFRLAVEDITSSSKSDKSSDKTNLWKIMNAYISTFQTLKDVKMDKILFQLVKDIKDYSIVKALGIGNTALSAEQLVYSMYSEDKFIEAVQDKIKIDYLESSMDSNYLLIIFSVTGSTETYKKIMTTAKKKGIKTYLITMNQESSLLKLTKNKIILPSTNIQNNDNTLYRVDNRTILYSFAEVISYYYAVALNR
ncbi:RpiR family regulatory protein [Companilactobacillus paralimentarius DSM 13238 = JCM 10415]|jgi:Transcriptional regulators|uniref:RpiR family regulatory protein n=1 Tax=Companilactobacillus paralimentarius DSM 13238 = JCM 10415 TaxID=1122151 RepID=A0A0R1PH21_9LACO|nr:MurR/RpiR family transcriptional regulator [Companilactobacillus paralimentarius]KAE9562353.1 hypothetical protein ATN96_12415 [Companilactobacillus paralimentarius]KRL31751.1 RpiR family regulatory protein [Companilactobacillus paralimentarius DSM 13238 = JCM 10415]MDR4934654.1 MurR/RpiR family transcriptional regulator [Companilactobacillus paralimentarius]QFR68794.1 SIS domain-containing protein [Companilactobacillus paralimentarius]